MLYLLVPLIAFLYASVGFGGATGYLAVMSLLHVSPPVMASAALLLNVLVAGISFFAFRRYGHLRFDLLWPFLSTSVPAAFLGGYFKIAEETYSIILYLVLTFVAAHLIFFSKPQDDDKPLRRLPLTLGLVLGLCIGLLSGVVGIGGGIFLSPVIIYLRWGNSKQASAVSSAFIVLNSISGLIGRFAGGTFQADAFALSLLPFGLLGALAGSVWGARKSSNLALRRALGLVMALASLNFWQAWFR